MLDFLKMVYKFLDYSRNALLPTSKQFNEMGWQLFIP